MTLFLHWLLWFCINLAATISPGPAFAMTVRTAMAHNRRAGLFQAMGLGLGIAVHVTLVACGLAYILAKSVVAFTILKYAGGAYLIYIGSKALLAKKRTPGQKAGDLKSEKTISDVGAFRTGFLTNLLNPKSMLFFSAMLTQFININTPWHVMILFGATSVVIEAGWFSIVTLVLTDARVKNFFLSIAHWIERVCGALLIALGLKLALSRVSS